MISYYNGVIFSDAGVQPQYAAIIFQVIRSFHFLSATRSLHKVTITVGILFSPLILARFDPRLIFMTGLGLNALCMLGLGLSFLLPVSLALPCLVASGLIYGLGVGPVPFILMSSLFTQKNKSAGSAIAQTFRALSVLVQMKVRQFTLCSCETWFNYLMKAFPWLLDLFGIGGVMLICSTMSILGALFAYFFIPPTRNKSIYELERMFIGSSKIEKT